MRSSDILNLAKLITRDKRWDVDHLRLQFNTELGSIVSATQIHDDLESDQPELHKLPIGKTTISLAYDA